MNKLSRTLTIGTAAALAITALVAAPAMAVSATPGPDATATVIAPSITASATGNVSAEIDGGTLGQSLYNIDLGHTALLGTGQQLTGTAASPWSFTDARGTGAGYNVTVSATNFLSAAATGGSAVDKTLRSIPASALTISSGTFTTIGSPFGTTDTAPSATGAIRMPTVATSGATTTPVTFLQTTAMGQFSFTPTFDLTIPANAYRANLTGGAGTDPIPYVSQVTFTIG